VPNAEQPFEIQELDKASAVNQHVRNFVSLPRTSIFELVRETFNQWNGDNAPRLGAALAYYAVFSLAPLLIVVIGVAGLAFGRQAAQGQIVWQIQDLVGREGAAAIQKMLESARTPAKGIFATLVGIVTLIFGASLVVSELRNSLNVIWKAPAPPNGGGFLWGIVRMIQQRFLSFAMVLAIGFLLLVSLVVNAALAGVGKYVQAWLHIPEAALHGISLVIWFAVTSVLFALIYKVLPDVKIAWSDVAVGSIVTSALFTIGKLLIALYLGKSTVASTYGAAGSLVVILLWVYYSAQIFFFGAEFTHVYANKYGSRLRSKLSMQPADLSSVSPLKGAYSKRPDHLAILNRTRQQGRLSCSGPD
jgi:membrane protein